jgi:O-antigen biosynthesis protein WbqV
MRDQPLALEDLLGRPETKLNRSDIRELVKDKRVLVTGAGGTIGSELVRQIAALDPKHLTLVEFSEYNLYKIDMEVRETFPYQSLSSLIGDVRDPTRISQVFTDEKPELVFHAAAIKHVPIAEENIRETILTNVMGTSIVADCAQRCECAAMVLISTDKAVYPSSVMGATKRLAEMYCQALDHGSFWQCPRFHRICCPTISRTVGQRRPTHCNPSRYYALLHDSARSR